MKKAKTYQEVIGETKNWNKLTEKQKKNADEAFDELESVQVKYDYSKLPKKP